MADIILSSEDLTVLGGPSSVSVDIDFGVAGARGSQFFVGYGQPNDPDTEIGQTPNIFDMYINMLTSDTEYLYLYQYQNVDGSATWVRLVKLLPNHYSDNNLEDFTSGPVDIFIPLINIVPPELIGTLTPTNFNVQVNVENSNPVATSLTIGSTFVTVDDLLHLKVTVSGIEYASSTWSALTGEKIVHLFITVV